MEKIDIDLLKLVIKIAYKEGFKDAMETDAESCNGTVKKVLECVLDGSDNHMRTINLKRYAERQGLRV